MSDEMPDKMPEVIWLQRSYGKIFSEKILLTDVSYIRCEYHKAEIAKLKKSNKASRREIKQLRKICGECAPELAKRDAVIAVMRLCLEDCSVWGDIPENIRKGIQEALAQAEQLEVKDE